MVNLVITVCLLFFGVNMVNAQEISASVIINTQQLGTGADQSLFQSLQKQITEFINNRKWTVDNFQQNERINCNFTLIITSISNKNQYNAQLIVQAARPVYNTSYQSALVNYRDQQVVFKYLPGQQINFNPNQVAGTDPLVSNLPAVLAYYVNIIVGLDYDSFKLNRGRPYFSKALDIVSGAPQNNDIKGWQAFDGQRNRYWLANNLNDNKFGTVHQILYGYFRGGLDSLYENDTRGRQNVLDALQKLQQVNQANNNSMLVQFFVENRNLEFIGIFKKASQDIKNQAINTLTLLNPQNADLYNSQLK